ncbi:hypothetical protein DB347_20835 [Opitutaceae bacterium EW11]|nr:hypothetical protein DB347_20835 [Opitutaceae bacterium EW11]
MDWFLAMSPEERIALVQRARENAPAAPSATQASAIAAPAPVVPPNCVELSPLEAKRFDDMSPEERSRICDLGWRARELGEYLSDKALCALAVMPPERKAAVLAAIFAPAAPAGTSVADAIARGEPIDPADAPVGVPYKPKPMLPAWYATLSKDALIAMERIDPADAPKVLAWGLDALNHGTRNYGELPARWAAWKDQLPGDLSVRISKLPEAKRLDALWAAVCAAESGKQPGSAAPSAAAERPPVDGSVGKN